MSGGDGSPGGELNGDDLATDRLTAALSVAGGAAVPTTAQAAAWPGRMPRRRTGLRAQAIATPGAGTRRDGSDAGDGVSGIGVLAGRHATGWLGKWVDFWSARRSTPTHRRRCDLDAANGTIAWTSEGRASSRDSRHAHGIVVTAVDGRRITARNASSGALLWASGTPEQVATLPLPEAMSHAVCPPTTWLPVPHGGVDRSTPWHRHRGSAEQQQPRSTASRIFLTRACNALVTRWIARLDERSGNGKSTPSSTATRGTAYRSPTRPVPSMSEVTTAADACGPSSSRRGRKVVRTGPQGGLSPRVD